MGRYIAIVEEEIDRHFGAGASVWRRRRPRVERTGTLGARGRLGRHFLGKVSGEGREGGGSERSLFVVGENVYAHVERGIRKFRLSSKRCG